MYACDEGAGLGYRKLSDLRPLEERRQMCVCAYKNLPQNPPKSVVEESELSLLERHTFRLHMAPCQRILNPCDLVVM